MSTYILNFGDELLTKEMKSFCIFWRFSVTNQRYVTKIEQVPYLLVHYSQLSDSIPFTKPKIENNGKLIIDGTKSDGVKITMPTAKCKNSLKWEFRNEVHQLHFFEAADKTTPPKEWIDFSGSSQLINLDVAAKDNITTIIHKIKLGDAENRIAYAVFEKDDSKGSTSLGAVFPLYQIPILNDILSIAKIDADGEVVFPKITIERDIKGGDQTVTKKGVTANYVTEDHRSNMTCGYLLIAQGNFKNIPLNHNSLTELYNDSFFTKSDNFIAYFSSLAQGGKDLGNRTLASVHDDEKNAVTCASDNLPVELFFIDKLNVGMESLNTYI